MLDPGPRLIVSAIVGSLILVGSIAASRKRTDRLLAEAERLADRGDQISAARMLNEATGQELEECVRAIEDYLAGHAPPALPEEVRRLAEAGEQLRAVERLRELSGMGLQEAMRSVESHLAGR